jgi:transcriptional regulator with XRE-family HTH domain
MSRVPKSEEARQFDQALGRRIAGARQAAGMKCKELAAAAGISPAGLYWYETGGTSCPPIVLSRIAQALGVSVTALMPKYISSSFPVNGVCGEIKAC